MLWRGCSGELHVCSEEFHVCSGDFHVGSGEFHVCSGEFHVCSGEFHVCSGGYHQPAFGRVSRAGLEFHETSSFGSLVSPLAYTGSCLLQPQKSVNNNNNNNNKHVYAARLDSFTHLRALLVLPLVPRRFLAQAPSVAGQDPSSLTPSDTSNTVIHH
jgi:hypothetical protein